MARGNSENFIGLLYKTKDNAEVDLVINRPDGKCFAIEIKASDNVKLNKLTGLKSFAKVNPKAKLLCASLVELPSGDEQIRYIALARCD